MARKPSGKTLRSADLKPRAFKATLQYLAGKLAWTGVLIPFDAARLWGKRGNIRVRGTINGFPFAGNLFPSGRGEHFLLVRKNMQQGGRARVGDVAAFRLEPDLAKRPLVMPPELARALAPRVSGQAQSKAVRRFYDSLSESIRRWCCNEVAKIRSSQARRRRAEGLAEQFLETIEAERDLPPQIRLAMQAAPGAYEGWQRMTPLQRRHQLLSICHYRNPESRARRIARAIELMVKKSAM